MKGRLPPPERSRRHTREEYEVLPLSKDRHAAAELLMSRNDFIFNLKTINYTAEEQRTVLRAPLAQ